LLFVICLILFILVPAYIPDLACRLVCATLWYHIICRRRQWICLDWRTHFPVR